MSRINAQWRFRLVVFWGFVSGFLPLWVNSSESVTIHTYHQAPPFITGEGTGLTYDLATYLSQHSNGTYQFTVEVLPRKRLDLMLDQTDMIIPWVIPAWFGPESSEQFQWTKTILEDGSIYIWKNDGTKRFTKPEDLKSYHLGGIQGYRYINIDPLVQSGEITRSDTGSEKQLLEMLLLRRVDVGISPYSASVFIMKENSWTNDLSFSSHSQFGRKFLLNTNNKQVSDYIENISKDMLADKKWLQTLHNYGLTNNILKSDYTK